MRLISKAIQCRLGAPITAALIFAGIIVALCFGGSAQAQPIFGHQDRESKSVDQQLWLVPTALPALAARAFVYRPKGNGPFPLALIAHASTENAVDRAQMPQPDYATLARALVARGFAVVIPERPGHGATAGLYREDQNGCEAADYEHAGQATADDIAAALAFMREQDFIAQKPKLVIGHSAGGFGALALAARRSSDVSAIIVFAPGRGGHADNRPGQICAPEKLIAATGTFGRGARIPVTWLVAANDSYFPPAFSKRMADAFRAGGDKVDFKIVGASGRDGHWLAETEDAVKAIAPILQGFTTRR